MDLSGIVENAVKLYDKDFANKFLANKEMMCLTLGIEYADSVDRARRAMVNIARSIRKSDLKYTKNNPNLVMVILKEPNMQPQVEFGEVRDNEKDKLFSLAVPIYEYICIFTYKLLKE